MRIFKYELPVTVRDFIIELPSVRNFLHFGLDCNDNPCLWFEVTDLEDQEEVSYYWYYTGDYTDDSLIHMGTVRLKSEGLILHLYKEHDQA